jgi:hypothetical protein
MTVAELKEKLKGLPGKVKVLTPCSDHRYRDAVAHRGSALLGPDGWLEDHGEEATPSSEYGVRNTVLVIS